ncbi:MAG: hypothetical protein QOE81_2156, partial [Verrucomicrobiota bacterium]
MALEMKKECGRALENLGSGERTHFSHSFFISSAIGSGDCRQIPRNWNAQDEFNHYAGAEDVDLRDGGE